MATLRPDPVCVDQCRGSGSLSTWANEWLVAKSPVHRWFIHVYDHVYPVKIPLSIGFQPSKIGGAGSLPQ